MAKIFASPRAVAAANRRVALAVKQSLEVFGKETQYDEDVTSFDHSVSGGQQCWLRVLQLVHAETDGRGLPASVPATRL